MRQQLSNCGSVPSRRPLRGTRLPVRDADHTARTLSSATSTHPIGVRRRPPRVQRAAGGSTRRVPSPTSAFSTRRPEATRHHTAAAARCDRHYVAAHAALARTPPRRRARVALRSCRPPAAGTSVPCPGAAPLFFATPTVDAARGRLFNRGAATCQRYRNYNNFAHPTRPILVSSLRGRHPRPTSASSSVIISQLQRSSDDADMKDGRARRSTRGPRRGGARS